MKLASSIRRPINLAHIHGKLKTVDVPTSVTSRPIESFFPSRDEREEQE